MAHWSSGYADFHEELYADPPTPVAPPRLRCATCDATFASLSELQQHAFEAHPIAHPALTLRGKVCGDARLLVQQLTTPADWFATHATWAHVNDQAIAVAHLGELLSASRGVVDVRLGNTATHREFSFDLAVARDDDLRGVDAALLRVIEDDDLGTNSINAFIDRARGYSTAGNYAAGLAEYLYWLAGMQAGGDAAPSVRNNEKLNRAAHLLSDAPRPAARAITSLISLYFNHFGEAADRALSSYLHDMSQRMDRMLAAHTGPHDREGISGELSHLERLLMDKHTAELVTLCALPLTPQVTSRVIAFECSTADPYAHLKRHLFTAEHHLATGNSRAAQLVRSGSRNGLPDHWVNARLNLITDEGTVCPPAQASPTAASRTECRKPRSEERKGKPRKAGPTSGRSTQPKPREPNSMAPTTKHTSTRATERPIPGIREQVTPNQVDRRAPAVPAPGDPNLVGRRKEREESIRTSTPTGHSTVVPPRRNETWPTAMPQSATPPTSEVPPWPTVPTGPRTSDHGQRSSPRRSSDGRKPWLHWPLFWKR